MLMFVGVWKATAPMPAVAVSGIEADAALPVSEIASPTIPLPHMSRAATSPAISTAEPYNVVRSAYGFPAPANRAADARTEGSVFYSGCREARAAGAAPIYRGQPGYRAGMDGDGDGIACEPYSR